MLVRLFNDLRRDLPNLSTATKTGMRRLAAWLGHVRTDIAIALALTIAMAAGCFVLAQRFPAEYLDPELNAWVWFEADPIRVFKTMTEHGPHNVRTAVHPLQALALFVPTKILVIAGLPERAAAIVILSGFAAIWAALLFAAMRGLGLLRLDAVIFTVLGASTSSAVFWFPTPEVHGAGAASLMLAFALATAIFRYATPQFLAVLASASTFAITSTNWMAGILIAVQRYGYRRAIRITFDALIVVTLLFAVQKAMDGNARFFVPNLHETTYFLHENSGGFANRAVAFWLHSVILPPVAIFDNPVYPQWFRMSVQFQPVSAFSLPALAAFGVWFALLVTGSLAALRHELARHLAAVLILYLCFEFLLHLIYGDETFLYSLNFVPCMVLLAACASLTRYRIAALLAAAGLAAFMLTTNLTSYIDATIYLAEQAAIVVGQAG